MPFCPLCPNIRDTMRTSPQQSVREPCVGLSTVAVAKPGWPESGSETVSLAWPANKNNLSRKWKKL